MLFSGPALVVLIVCLMIVLPAFFNAYL